MTIGSDGRRWRLASALGFVIVAGCASIPEMRSREPNFTATTQKPFAEVRDCIGEEWVEKVLPTAVSSPFRDGVSFRYPFQAPNIMVDLIDQGEARLLNVYFRKVPISILREKLHIATLRRCL